MLTGTRPVQQAPLHIFHTGGLARNRPDVGTTLPPSLTHVPQRKPATTLGYAVLAYNNLTKTWPNIGDAVEVTAVSPNTQTPDVPTTDYVTHTVRAELCPDQAFAAWGQRLRHSSCS